jgi:hypothetical protein
MVFRWSTRILVIDTDASRRIHFTSLFRYSEAVVDASHGIIRIPWNRKESQKSDR